MRRVSGDARLDMGGRGEEYSEEGAKEAMARALRVHGWRHWLFEGEEGDGASSVRPLS